MNNKTCENCSLFEIDPKQSKYIADLLNKVAAVIGEAPPATVVTGHRRCDMGLCGGSDTVCLYPGLFIPRTTSAQS